MVRTCHSKRLYNLHKFSFKLIFWLMCLHTMWFVFWLEEGMVKEKFNLTGFEDMHFLMDMHNSN